MPEGPEVKIMMGNVANLALGQTLLNVEVIKEDFRKKTQGLDQLPMVLPKRVIGVETKGKLGYMLLDDGTAIVLTFGMTGNIRIEPTPEYLVRRGETKEQYMKHCKIRFQMQDTVTGQISHFYFHCMRNFAWVYYFTSTELGKKLSTIGPSILSDDLLEERLLIARWRKYNHKTICETLMEQKLISGIGNYIKAEILYRCRVYPLAKVKDLSDSNLWLLYMEARKIAADAYADGGASLYTYTGINGDRSDFKLKLQVYDRAVDPLGNKIGRLQTPDKRTTHWVESLQTIGKQLPPPIVKIRPKIKALALSQK